MGYFWPILLGELMTSAEIIDLYDRNPDLTLRQLQNLTGRSIAALKGLLMHPEPAAIDTAKGSFYACVFCGSNEKPIYEPFNYSYCPQCKGV